MRISLKIAVVLAFLFLPCLAFAQWTYTPGYSPGTPTWTYDAATQPLERGYRDQSSPEMNIPDKRIDPRRIKRLDTRQGTPENMGRFDLRQRPMSGGY